jgi:hypothetical protein
MADHEHSTIKHGDHLLLVSPRHHLDALPLTVLDLTGSTAPPLTQRAPPKELPLRPLHHRERYRSAQDTAERLGHGRRLGPCFTR